MIASRETAIKDHTHTRNMTHPLAGTVDRYIVGDRFHDSEKTSGHKKPTCKYHHMDLCPELVPYQSVTSEVLIRATRLKSSNQQNLVHYFIYNRLMDHWNNRERVEKQRALMLKNARAGKVSLVTSTIDSTMCAVPANSVDTHQFIAQLYKGNKYSITDLGYIAYFKS